MSLSETQKMTPNWQNRLSTADQREEAIWGGQEGETEKKEHRKGRDTVKPVRLSKGSRDTKHREGR